MRRIFLVIFVLVLSAQFFFSYAPQEYRSDPTKWISASPSSRPVAVPEPADDSPEPASLPRFPPQSVNLDATEAALPEVALAESAEPSPETAIDTIYRSERLPADAALHQLRPLFDHPRSTVRLAAYEALADMTHPERMMTLAWALLDPEAEIRIVALEGLAIPAHDDALPYIEYGLADPVAGVRIAALDALIDFEAQRVMPALSAMLFDPDTEVRRHAVAVLGEVGGNDSRVYLLQASYDPDPDTRAIAQSILHEQDISRPD